MTAEGALFFKAYLLRFAVGSFCPLFFDYVIYGFGLLRRLLFGFLLGRGRLWLQTFKAYERQLEDVHYCETHDEDD